MKYEKNRNYSDENGMKEQLKYGSAGLLVGLCVGVVLFYILLPYRTLSANARYQPDQGQIARRQGSVTVLRRQALAPMIGRSFVNQDGQPVRTHNLLGHMELVTFIDPLGNRYSPVIVENLLNLYQHLENLGWLGNKVRFVSYNVNPKASFQECGRFLKQISGISISPKKWECLTAKTPTNIHRIALGYGFQDQPIGTHAFKKRLQDREKRSLFVMPKSVNPLHGSGDHEHYVNHDELYLIGPRDHIWFHTNSADSISDVMLLSMMVKLSQWPGMPSALKGQNQS